MIPLISSKCITSGLASRISINYNFIEHEKSERKDMGTLVTIQHVRAEDILSILQEKYKIKPQQELTITFEVKATEPHLPPYDVPKKHSEDAHRILENAKMRLKKKKAKGYSREQAFDDLFKVQKKIAKHIKENQE